MNKKILFEGTATALITPFSAGEIDFVSLKKIIENQIEGGINALVVGGTTAEISTLSFEEKLKLYDFALGQISGRVPVLLGCGSNDTTSSIALAKAISKLGADGILSVTPYYNKGTDEGIKKHYLLIAEAAELPMIVYNVPSRTGVNLGIGLIEELAEYETIVGIKEASDSQERLSLISSLGGKMPLYAGNDTAALSVMALGGYGVISVVSNLLPRATVMLSEAMLANDLTSARRISRAILPLTMALFAEVNPVPIKYAMSLIGLSSPETRLPLSTAKGETASRIERELDRLKRLAPELAPQ